MSRSRRKTPIYGISTATSEKEGKRIWHKRMRTCERDRLRTLVDPEAHLTTLVPEVSNCWSMEKDGRQWWGWTDQKRRVAERYPLDDEISHAEALSLRRRDIAKYRGK